MLVYPDLASIQAAFPKVDPSLIHGDMAYPAMIKFVPAGWLGVVVASLMGALFSTIAAQLSMGANYVAHDVWKRFVHPSANAHELVTVARWTSIALMVAGALLAPLLADAKAGFDLMVMVGAGTGAVFLLRWFWMRINAWTEIVALGVSIVCAVFLQMVGPHVFALSLAFWQRLQEVSAAIFSATISVQALMRIVRASGRDVGLGVLWTFLVSVAIFAFMWAVGALLEG